MNNEKIVKSNIQDILPLSPMQEGMLFHYLYNSGTDTYFEQLSLRLEGDINISILKKAWNHVVKTNEALRTVFRWDKLENPVQIILKSYEVPIIEYDLSEQQNETKDKLLQKLKADDLAKGLDISSQPMRVMLCKLSSCCYEMIISNHHILYDGWSNGIILKELLSAYNCFYEGNTPLVQLKRGYKDYIKLVKEVDREEQKKFWKSYLNGFEARTGIPKSASKTNRVKETERLGIRLSDMLTEGLESFSRQHKVTLAAILYGAWGILLQRYNNTEDVLFGTTVSGRTSGIDGIQDMVGMLINTLPLRAKTDSIQTINEYINSINSDMLARYHYEDTPLVTIKACSNIDKKESLFETAVVMENYPLSKVFLTNNNRIKITAYNMYETTNYELLVNIEVFDGINICYCYNSVSYEKQMVENLANHYKNILEEIVAEPYKRVSQIKMLSVRETNQLLYGFNDPKSSFSFDKTIHSVFEEQVRKTPDRIAVISDNGELTYDELNKKANHLAVLLRQKGIKRNDIVGVFLDRSQYMMIGLLGILKAGAAYLPIDTRYPRNRIDYILDDSKAKLIITTKEYLERFRDSNIIICLDGENNNSNENCNIDNINTPQDLAYVIYTSGSTGNPKGVMIEHQSVINRLCWMQNKYPIFSTDTILQKTPYTFDVSVWELFWWFFNGSKLCFLKPNGEKNPEEIISAIKKNGITIIHFVPSMLSAFMEYISIKGCIKELSSLRQVFSSGEALKERHVEQFYKLWEENKKPLLSNLYGPTEATVDVTYYDCPFDGQFASIPIGKPIYNTGILILDRYNNLQPVGAEGELCITGIGVARGYLNRPELNREKFVANPFTDLNFGSRGLMYRTGDIAKWLPDGNILYIGRMDNQVKIRGLRVELGEIEARLQKHAGIKNAAVVLKENTNRQKLICAYIVTDEKPEIQELRNFILEELPDYMVPSYFEFIEKLPVTDNGKLDVKKLPVPCLGNSGGANRELPSDEIEEKLLFIWRKILGSEAFGTTDNFFDVGGNSILMIRMLSQVEKEFPGTVTITDLFNNSTIKKLSGHIHNKINVSKSEIEINGLVFPSEYCSDGDTDKSPCTLEYGIYNEELVKIKELADYFQTEAIDIILAIYLFLFNRLSENPEVTVYTTVNSKDLIRELKVDFRSFECIKDLVEAVKIKQAQEEGNFYTVTDINDNYPVKRKNEGAGIFIYNKSLINYSFRPKEIFDLVFEFVADNYGYSFICDYNADKFRGDKIEEIIYNFTEFLNVLFQEYIAGRV